MEKQDKFLILVSDLLVYKRQVARVQLSTLDCLTESKGRPIVVLWEELTPRGNMVHLEIEREDGVQDQLVLGSLKSSQDFRRT